ncbi:hypothetical protein IQ07DRAFT_599977 [Pyrenochaeta sp. DS3sAY3a]|nr:hypothetical protein IQ07DRAFT_599977 [Pyrenochaeta sp. DS3sAY3a]
MSSDTFRLRVIWPPNSTRPLRHSHNVVFVHGLHHESISSWRDARGVCWPVEHLPSDLRNARVLKFRRRKPDKVPITFIEDRTGAVIIKSSAAQESSTELFGKIKQYFDVTSLNTDAKQSTSRPRTTNSPADVQRIRSWLQRQPDNIIASAHQKNLAKHLPESREWLFQESKFHD